MKILLFLIVFTFQLILLNGQEIVILYGSGSTGKSTLSREIVNLNQNWCHIDEDEIFNEMYIGYISEHFPIEYKIISDVLPVENIFQAVKNSTIIFPKESTDSQMIIVKNSIKSIQNDVSQNDPEDLRRKIFQHFQLMLVERVQEKLTQDKSIILDRWYTTPEMLKKAFPDINIKKILVFSTLQHTFNNFKKRNEAAVQTRNSYSHRLYKNFIPSFVRLYKLSEDPTNSLQCCHRSEIENIFNEIKNDLLIEKSESKKDNLFNDMTKEGLEELSRTFIPSKSTNNTLFLTPIDQYDLIIHTQGIDFQKFALEFSKKTSTL